MIRIDAGRNPIIDHLLEDGEQYVPNDTDLSVSEPLLLLPVLQSGSMLVMLTGICCIHRRMVSMQ